MPVLTLFISGPAGGGKSTVANLIATRVVNEPAHYLRVRKAADGHTNLIVRAELPEHGDPVGRFWKSMHNVIYTEDRVYETVPDGLRAVRSLDLYGFIVMEADGERELRHAYPYDYRVFVMPSPTDLNTVFRSMYDAATALQQVMQDTASFASEIFGLFDSAVLGDNLGVAHEKPTKPAGRGKKVEQLDISESQLQQFIGSPIGAEIASRIQLQRDYHALIESDIVVINTGLGGQTKVLQECIHRLKTLLARVQQDARRRSVLYWGDVTNSKDPSYNKLIRRFQDLLAG